jgi:hypothetical protein
MNLICLISYVHISIENKSYKRYITYYISEI